MLKVTIKFSALLCILFAGAVFRFVSCTPPAKKNEGAPSLQFRDSVSEARIDSFYAAIRTEYDTALLHIVPMLADSLIQGDSGCVRNYFSSKTLFSDSDAKVEKVVRQLRADLDSNLLKETYKRVQLLKRSKPGPNKKPKV